MNEYYQSLLDSDDPQLRRDAAMFFHSDGRLKTAAEVQAAHIRAVLGYHGGNMSAAAENLGMYRQRLYRLMKKHGIKVERHADVV